MVLLRKPLFGLAKRQLPRTLNDICANFLENNRIKHSFCPTVSGLSVPVRGTGIYSQKEQKEGRRNTQNTSKNKQKKQKKSYFSNINTCNYLSNWLLF